MDLNDQLGDCTIAGVDHLLAIWNVTYSQNDQRPNTTNIEDTYLELTGGVDSGLVEADVLKTWQTQGLFGNHIYGYIPVNPQDLVELQQAIAFYGALYVGVQLPNSAEDQFAQNQPWTIQPGAQIAGGHCIILVGYDAQYLYAVSWGQVVKVSYPWWHFYGDEAWCVLSNQLKEKGSDQYNLDYDSLEMDLASL